MDNKASWNKIARRWSDSRKDSFVSRPVKDFADRIKPCGHILDIGCGSGSPLTQYLSDRNFYVTGIDVSEEMIAMAKANSIAKTHFSVCDCLEFVTSDKFDAVLAWDSLWHLPKNKQKDIYLKIGSLLQPGGYFLFTHGNIDGEHTDTMMSEPFYYSALSESDVTEQLSESGFQIEYVHRNFIENDSHRAFVVPAKRTFQTQYRL